MPLSPVDRSARSFIYRELEALGAAFEEVNGQAAAMTCGEDAAEEAAAAARLGLCDVSALPRAGYKGWNAVAFVEERGAEVGEAANRAYAQKDGTLFARLALGEVLVLGPLGGEPGLIDTLARAWSMEDGVGAYPVPRQDTNFWYRITGECAAGMFAKLCGVDLRPGAFANREVAQTSIAKLNGIVVRDDLGELPAYHLLSDSAGARYIWTCLLDAADEFAGRPVGLATLRALRADEPKAR